MKSLPLSVAHETPIPLMADLYSRVYHLPERIEKARERVLKARRIILFLACDARAIDHKRLANAQRRLNAVENEARQLNWLDLLNDA